MGLLVWVMVGLALWHFTVFVPDRFWGGIVGAFTGAVIGSVIEGEILHGLSVPGRDETDVLTALDAVRGRLLGMGAVYLEGARRESARA